MSNPIGRRSVILGGIGLGTAALLGNSAAPAQASVASKPSTPLVIDGIWGNKSEDMCSYAFNVDQSHVRNSSTTIQGIFDTEGWKKVQGWLNLHPVNRTLTVDGLYSWHWDTWWSKPLVVDGSYGLKTEAFLGAAIIRASAGYNSTWFPIYAGDFQEAAQSIAMFQCLLNGIVLRKRSTGPGYNADNGMNLVKVTRKTWTDLPAGRFTG